MAAVPRTAALAAVARRRYVSAALDGPRFSTAEAVVRWFGAVQAQEYGLAKWGLAQRITGSPTAADIEAELDTGLVVRTHVLRPTWHWVALDDLPWMLTLTAPRVRPKIEYYDRQLGVSPQLRSRTVELVGTLLSGGVALSRKQLLAALAEAGLRELSAQMVFNLMQHAELDGLVCSGPRAGSQHTYMLLQERLSATGLSAPEPPRDEALARLATMYFRSHGPATAVDFRWWSGLTAVQGRDAIAAAGPALQEETIDGVRYWACDTGDSAEPVGVRLLQAYDEYTVAHTQSKPAVVPEGGLAPGMSLPYLHTVIDSTQVVGHWRPAPRAGRLDVQVRLYRAPTERVVDELQAETGRVATFMGLAAGTATVEGG